MCDKINDLRDIKFSEHSFFYTLHMALAETFLRKVHKLGIVPKLIKLLPVISFCFALSSVVWLLVLPIEGNYRNTYISENALMPSQVMSYFRESEWNIVRGYRDEIALYEDSSSEVRNDYIETMLNKFGFVTSYHQNTKFADTLYGIMHAPRGDDTEAMVLTIPSKTSDGEYNEGGLAISLALARYFRRASIWSKNIIFVYPENGHYPLRSWVEAYHTSLENTAGSIDAAIVLEYGKNGDHFDYYEMAYEGLNGQLPNLDLLNTANMIAYHENMHCSIQKTPGVELTKNTYYTRLRTLLGSIFSLVLSGLKKNTSGHEAFSGWQIQAFTIKARGNNGPNDVTQFGRVIDSTFRSVNNLLEKFHQSFFFYLMLSPRYFVSIGTYLPSAILVAVAFVFSSLGALLNSNIEIYEVFASMDKILTIFTVIECSCYGLSVILPRLVLNASDTFKDATAMQILHSLAFASLALTVLPLISYEPKFKLSKVVTLGLIAFSLFFIAMLITTLLIVNFSLALTIGLLSIPLTFVWPLRALQAKMSKEKIEKTQKKDPLSRVIAFTHNNKSSMKTFLSLAVSNPFIVIILVGSYLSLDNDPTFLMKSLLTSWDELQSWTWHIVILGWFPAWACIALSNMLGDFEVIQPQAEISGEKS